MFSAPRANSPKRTKTEPTIHKMIQKVRRYLESRLTPNRLRHVEGVVKTSLELARRHGLNLEHAEQAALLHDSQKWRAKEDQLAACERWGVHLDANDRAHPPVWHAFAGAAFARKRFGACEEVCQAARRHTTGWTDMSALDMALYAADFCEPGRLYPQAVEVYRESMRDLERGVLLAMRYRLQFLLERGASIHPRTVEARNQLLRRLEDSSGSG